MIIAFYDIRIESYHSDTSIFNFVSDVCNTENGITFSFILQVLECLGFYLHILKTNKNKCE